MLRCCRSLTGDAHCAAWSTIASGSSMRPGPTSPHAWLPLSGPQISRPRAASCCRLCCVTAARYICWFIAGTTATGAAVARQAVVTRSLAIPACKRAIRSADAGASTTKSAHFASSIWPIAASAAGSSRSSNTGWPETACRLSGVIKALAAGVIITRTSAPRSRRRRTSSGALYAAMPPLTPSRIFFPANPIML